MNAASPVIVVFTRHAERRAVERGVDLHDLAELLLSHHPQRQPNRGAADWLVRARGIAVVYNWPDGDDATALVISVWRE